MTRDELREQIAQIIGDAIDYDREIETDDQVADRILALIPTQPKLEWRGAQLFLGELRVGYIAEDRNGQMIICAGEKIIGGAMPMDVARAAVEQAVRKALGMSHD